MTILQAKDEIKKAVQIYLDQDGRGNYYIPYMKQRPIFMVGAPGIGKTAIVEQIAQEMGIGLVCYAMTHHTRQSAIGLPFISEKTYGGEKVRISEYTMSEIIASVHELIEKSGKDKGIIFLDEINCVSETLAPAILQFLQYKRFGNHSLPQGWIIVSAGNPPQYNKSVREFDIATRDRLKYIYVEEDFGAWRKYAFDRGVHGAITSFLEVNKSWFYRIQTTSDGPKYATARGWEDLSFAVKGYEKRKIDVNLSLVIQYITDPDIARRFTAFYDLYKKYRENYRVSDILEGSWSEEISMQAKKAGFDERISLIELIDESLMETFSQVMEEQNVLENAAIKLRAAKKAASEASGIREYLFDAAAEIDEQRKRNSFSGVPIREEDLVQRLVAEALRELAEKVDLQKQGEKAFAPVKRGFDLRAKKQAAAVDNLKAKIENVFRFLEECFGVGQEMTFFMTVMTANRHSSSFLAKFGSESYFRHNEELLVYDLRENLRKDIQTEGLLV